jgi:hypothetical protein
MEINQQFAHQAMTEALDKFPQFARFGPVLVWRALFQGGAFQLIYAEQPPQGDPDAWEFQNAVVKGYKRLAGV